MNVSRRKNEVKVSLAYKFPLRAPRAACGFGDASIGMTAGRGANEGAGDAERRIDGDEAMFPREDLRLWLIALGGFIGNGCVVGVPGVDGAGDPMATESTEI